MNDEFKMNDKFDKLIGKWCLYRHSYERNFNRIFVHSVKDGIVMYSTDKNRDNAIITYVDNFRHCEVIESPFDKFSVSDCEECDSEADEHTLDDCGIFRKKPNYCSENSHDWVHIEYMSSPGIHGRYCRICGKEEHIDSSGKWVDGKY